MRHAVLALVAGFAAGLAALTCTPRRALAQPGPAPVSRVGSYSPYELASIREAEERFGAKVDPSPEGKLVEHIDIVTLDVFEPRDPVPGFINEFHATSRPYVIAREVLQREGEAWNQFAVDETARNLRTISQLSLVVCVPLVGSTPDRVRLIVITKDVWSLRLSWDLALASGGLEKLLLQPGETNVLGLQQTVALSYLYLPKAQTFGAKYLVPRLFGSRVATSTSAAIILNNSTSKPEGSAGSFSIGQPLYSARSTKAWAASASWRSEITRRYSNAQVAYFPKIDAPERVHYQYRSESRSAGVAGTLSFGFARKHDLSAGFSASQSRYASVEEPASAILDRFFATRVPVGETRVGPYVEYHAYASDFMRILDSETLGLQEDRRLGHDVYLRAMPITEALGSTRTFLSVYAAAQYTVPLGDGFALAAVEWLTETEKEKIADASLSGSLRIVSPRTGIGRLVFDATATSRYRNYLHQTFVLGGGSRLRGYPTNYFDGKDVIAYNTEFRFRPLEILSCQIGAAAFFDSGNAFDGFENLRIFHSTGMGLRVLFPQLDRIVFRGDLGFPVGPRPAGPRLSPVSFFFGFGQAFSAPSLGL